MGCDRAVDGEPGKADGSGDASASSVTVDPRPIARRKRGVEREKEGRGETRWDSSRRRTAHPRLVNQRRLCSVPAATRSTNDEGLKLGQG